MGYYTGGFVNVSKRRYTNCVHSGWEVTWVTDPTYGRIPVLTFKAYWRKYLEKTNVKRGVEPPEDSAITSSATVDARGVITASSTKESRRIGDSNLFEIVETNVTSEEVVSS